MHECSAVYNSFELQVLIGVEGTSQSEPLGLLENIWFEELDENRDDGIAEACVKIRLKKGGLTRGCIEKAKGDVE